MLRSIATSRPSSSACSAPKILLHEMAHMWFGNIVTMRWWDDLWLNEAFAEFAAHWSAVSATEFPDMWAAHLARGQLQAYLADQGPASHPIRQRVPDVAAAAGTFDTITYPKGASVLHQLMAYIGEDAFVAGMRSYFARYAWTNTTLDELDQRARCGVRAGLASMGARLARHWRAWTGFVSSALRMATCSLPKARPGRRRARTR